MRCDGVNLKKYCDWQTLSGMGVEGGGRNAVAKLFVFILDVSINILADYGL